MCSADPSPSPPVRDVGPFPSGPPCSPYSELEESSLTANGVCILTFNNIIILTNTNNTEGMNWLGSSEYFFTLYCRTYKLKPLTFKVFSIFFFFFTYCHVTHMELCSNQKNTQQTRNLEVALMTTSLYSVASCCDAFPTILNNFLHMLHTHSKYLFKDHLQINSYKRFRNRF